MPEQEKSQAGLAAGLVFAVAVLVFLTWQCVSAATSYDPPERPRSTPAEERELEQAKRTVETTCALWWDDQIELPDHQAQVCVDGGYGK